MKEKENNFVPIEEAKNLMDNAQISIAKGKLMTQIVIENDYIRSVLTLCHCQISFFDSGIEIETYIKSKLNQESSI